MLSQEEVRGIGGEKLVDGRFVSGGLIGRSLGTGEIGGRGLGGGGCSCS